MADMTPLTDILNDDPATATPVQNNFQTIEAYINGTNLVRTDGTEVMTADLDLDGNKVVNLAAATAAADAPRFDQTGFGDAATLGSGVVAGTSATNVTSFSVNLPAAGIARIIFLGTVTTSGVTYGGGNLGLAFSVTGVTATAGASALLLISSDRTETCSGSLTFTLPSGASTVTVQVTRSGSPTGGTATVDSGCRFGLIGAF